MSVIASDLVVYGAQNIAESDGLTQGGAINTNVRYVFNDPSFANTLNDTLEVLSSSVSDTTQTLTVTGRNAGGEIVSEPFSLNGTTVVNGATSFERILKVVLSGTAVGTVTVRKATGDTTVAALEPGLLQIRRPFYNVSSDLSGGSSRDFYEKLFIKNNNGTSSLLSAIISETGDTLAKVTFDLEDAVNDNNSIASRLNTAPTGMLGTFTSAAKNVPGTNLAAGAAIGVWIKLTLAAGDAPNKGTWTVEIAGSTA